MKKIFFILCFVYLVDVSFAGVAVIGSLTHENTTNPGETYEGSIILQNTGKDFCDVIIYKNDYIFYANGESIYGKPGSTPRSNANWISLSPNRVVIPPESTTSVFYTVQVPKNPHLKGSYWSIIMIEPKVEKLKKGDGLNIQALLRYGVQIITNIGETGISKIKFIDKKIIQDGKKRVLRLDIKNTGERKLSPSVWAELYNKTGICIGRFEGRQLRIYPGCSIRQDIDLTNVPKGEYKALVIADNGNEEVFGAQYDLKIQ